MTEKLNDIEFERYLIEEIENINCLDDADIAKFIIQAMTGPYHAFTSKPERSTVRKRFVEEYNNNKHHNKKDMYQQISSRFFRINIVPYVRKHREIDSLCDMFLMNFDISSNQYVRNIPVRQVQDMLIRINIIETELIIGHLNNYNNAGQMPHHSKLYKEHMHPAYTILSDEIIKKNITLI